MDQTKKKPVLVLGGTGHYGRYIVRSLLNKGENVRVLSRNINKARKILDNKVDLIKGDIRNNNNLKECLNNVKGIIICISAFTPKLIKNIESIERDSILFVLEEAEKRNISKIIYISVYDLDNKLIEKYNLKNAVIKAEIEEKLKESGFNWIILGVPPSMEIFHSMIKGKLMIVPGGGPPLLPTISPLDVGELTAKVLIREDLNKKRIKINGPEALSFQEAANRISKLSNRKISLIKIPLFLPILGSNFLKLFGEISNKAYFAAQMIGYIRLLNNFPQNLAEKTAEVSSGLVETFDYKPTTLEEDYKKRKQ